MTADSPRDLIAGPPFMLTEVRLWPRDREPSSVLVVGSDGRLEYAGRARRPLDTMPALGLDGAWLLPGFVDPHIHVRASASARAAIDISTATSTGEILDLVKRHSSADEWISMWGLQPEQLIDGPPTAEQLDSASGGRLVRIRHRSTHAWVFSTAALHLFGLGTTPVPAGAHVERRVDGTPTGLVVDHSGWVGDLVGRVTPIAELEHHVRAWSSELAAQGIVAMVDATARNRESELKQLAEWRAAGIIRQRLAALASTDIESAPSPVRFVGHKLMPPFGSDLHAEFTESWSKGIAVAVHCVEPDELGAVIETVESIPAERRGRLRIEHASHVPPDWLGRVAELGGYVVTHPSFVYAHGDRYLADREAAPHEWLYRLASWRRSRVSLAFASDAPAGPTPPLLGIRAAIQRRTASGNELGPDEALSLSEAIACATGSAAQAAGLADEGFGRFTRGKPVNAVVIAAGPDGPSGDDASVIATIIEGHVIEPV